MAMQAEFYRKQGHEVIWKPEWYHEHPDTYQRWGKADGYDKVITEPENLPFLTLPRPDRVFTRAKEYDSGNYKYKPGTHILSASGCWWGKCSFCVENNNNLIVNSNNEYCICPEYQYQGNTKTTSTNPKTGKFDSLVGCSNQSNPFQPVCWKCLKIRKEPEYKSNYEVRPIDDVISEIEECKSLGFKEVFDDSATFPTGRWLDDFIRDIRRIDSIRFSCNTRISNEYPYVDMFRAGFRMLLFGIESANEITLNKINKGVKVEDIILTIKKASDSGLDCHGAFMFGYPWETDKDALRTLKLCHYLLRKGYLQTAQASLYCPQGVSGNQAHKKFVKKIYNAAYYPDFWFNKLRDIHNLDDLRYLWLQIKKGIQR